MKHSTEIGKLAEALSKAQRSIKNPEKNIQGAGDYKTAPLSSYFEGVKQAFARNGLSFSQDLTTEDEAKLIRCKTIIMHESGQWLRTSILSFTYEKDTPEDRGKCINLVKRHSFQAAIGVTGKNEAEDGGIKNDYVKQFPSSVDRKAAKQSIINDLDVIEKEGNAEELQVVWGMHRETIDKLALEDPQYIVDIVRKKKALEEKFAGEKDNLKGKI